MVLHRDSGDALRRTAVTVMHGKAGPPAGTPQRTLLWAPSKLPKWGPARKKARVCEV
jgi:hypothetical protein